MSKHALARALDAVRSYWRGPYNLRDPLTGIFTDPPAAAGVTVNEYTALNYSAVWAAVQRISGDVGSLPLVLYRRTGNGGKEPMREHPLYRLLHDQPNPEMTAVVFRETLQAHLLTWGNAYAEIEWSKGGQARYLWPIAPNRVTPERDSAGSLYYKIQNSNGTEVEIDTGNILHIPGLGYDGTCGYSPIRMARDSIGLGLATERFGGAFFGNGTTFGGILTHPGRLSEPARKQIRESIKAMHGGPDRALKMGIFEEGMTFTQLGVPPDDAQFLETRKFQVTEIARWYQIPPHMLGDLERATFSNIEEQQIDYTTGTLRRWLVRWEQEVNRKLVLQPNLQFVEHNLDGLLRGNIESRYQAYAVGRQWGWLSADDVRAKENMNPLPDNTGAIYLVPQNMAPADRINDIIDAQTEPEPAAEVPFRSTDNRDVLAQIELLRQEHVDHIARLESATVSSRDAVTGEVSNGIAALRSDMVTAEQARTEAERKASEAGARLEVLQAEFRQAQEKHREQVEAELTERLRLEAELDRQAKLVQTLEADVANRTKLLDGLYEARDLAVQAADQAREAERVALAEKVVSANEAASLREAVVQSEQKLLGYRVQWDKALHEVKLTASERDDALKILNDMRGQLETTSADLVQNVQTASERARALLKLESELEAAKAELAREQQRASAAEEAKTATDVQLVARSQELVAHRQSETDRLSAVLGAHRSLVADAVGRIVRRHVTQARRYQATPEKLRHFLDNFSSAETVICIEALLPTVRAHLKWMMSDADPAEVTASFVKDHLVLFETKLRSAADAEPEDFHGTLEAVLQRWEADRPLEVADKFLQEGVAYIRAR